MPLHAPDYGQVDFGHFALIENGEISEESGGQITVTGQESSPPATLAEIALQHEQVLALQIGHVYGVTFTDKDDRNGYYLIERTDSRMMNHQDEVVTVNWTVTMTRMGSDKEIDLQSRLTPTVRDNDFSLTGERWHAPAMDHYAYYAGSTVPSTLTRTGTEGSITVYRGVDTSVAPRWGCDAESYTSGMARIAVSTNGDVYNGIKHELGAFWNLHNGLINLAPSATAGTFHVYYYANDAFHSKEWSVLVNGVAPVWDGTSILKNDPEHVVVRLTASRTPGRVSLDVGLRRGSRSLEMYLQSGTSASLDVFLASAENYTDTSASGYLVADQDDEDGNRFTCGSARTFTAHANGGVSKSAATFLDCYVGYVTFGGSLSDIDGTFESGATNWIPTNGTFEQSSTQAKFGSFSGLLTTTGTPALTYVRPSTSVHAPVAAGVDYKVSFWAYSPAGYANLGLAIDWQDSGSVYLSTNSTNVAISAGVWSYFEATFTAPASAAFAVHGPTLGTNPPTGTQLYIDNVELRAANNDGDSATDLRDQYIGSMAESTYAVRR